MKDEPISENRSERVAADPRGLRTMSGHNDDNQEMTEVKRGKEGLCRRNAPM